MGAWQFDGVDDRFVVTHDATALNFEPLTILCWVWFTATDPGDMRIVNKMSGGSAGYWNFTERNNTWRMRTNSGSNSAEGGTTTTGRWWCVSADFDSADGTTAVHTVTGGVRTLEAVDSGGRSAYNTNPLTIGSQNDGGSAFAGYIYAVALFDRILTDAEHINYAAGTMPATPRLLWLLDTSATTQPSTGTYTNSAVATGPTWDAAKTVPVTYGGAAPPNEGTATGATTWTGTATGSSPRAGTATGTTTWTGTAAGTAPTVPAATGTATGTVTWTGTATGEHTATGTGSGATTWTGTAAGTTGHAGTAAGTTTWTGAAAGTAPTVGAATGATTGATTWTGAAQGATTHTGAVTGTTTWTGTAAGTAGATGLTPLIVGGQLGAGWTHEPGTPATVATTTATTARIRLRAGHGYDAPTQTITTDTAPGFTHPISGDFDVTTHVDNTLYDAGDNGWGVAIYGTNRAQDHVVIGQRLPLPGASNALVRRVLHRDAGALTTTTNDTTGVYHADYLRVTRTGTTWTVAGTRDGLTWETWATFTAAFTPTTFKVYAATFGEHLGLTLPVRSVTDATEDVRPTPGPTGATTWATDFTTMPAWLQDRSTSGGTATATGGTLNLTKTTTTASSAFVVHTARTRDVDVTWRMRLNTDQIQTASFFVAGVAGHTKADQYSLDQSRILEISAANLNVLSLRVLPSYTPPNAAGDLNTKYDLLNPPTGANADTVPTGWGHDVWVRARMRWSGSRVRFRGWADGASEPSTWDYDAADSTTPADGHVWLSWAQNQSTAASSTILVDDLTIVADEVTTPTATGVDAIPGLLGRWRADDLDNDTGTGVNGWPSTGTVNTWLTAKSTSQPTVNDAAIGGRRAVTFPNNGATRLQGARNLREGDFSLAALTYITVVRMNTATGTQVFADGVVGRAASFLNAGKWAMFANTVRASTVNADTNPHVVTATYAATRASSTLHLDGTQIATGTPGTSVARHIVLGSEEAGGTPANVTIAEVFVFDRELTSGERATVHSYVQDTYGITVSDYTAPAPPTGTAGGSTTWTGTAAGSAGHAGTATGAATWTGTATGTAPARGTATGTWATTGTAVGTTDYTGTAAGATTWTGTASGTAPGVATATGTASGTWTTTGTAAGRKAPAGVATGTVTWTGTASGATTPQGTATGQWVITGTAAGIDPNRFRDITLTIDSLGDRWATETIPARWATTDLPARLRVEATTMHNVRVGSAEYQRARITETDGQDITAATIQVAVTDTTATPTSGWAAPDVITRPTPDVADVSVLHAAATAGERYLHVRVTDNPEVALRYAGRFTITP